MKGCHFFRMWRLITLCRSWRPIWWRNTLGGSERPWSFWALDVQALPFDMIYWWFALIFLASFKKRQCFFFFGLGSRNSNRFGVFSCARFGFEASLSSATFRLWEAGNIRKMPLGRWVFSSWDNSHVSRFFPMSFFWNTSFFFPLFELPSHPFIFDHL